MNQIEHVLIKESDRVTHTANLFGFHFPLHLEHGEAAGIMGVVD